jgi:hypothetical protein
MKIITEDEWKTYMSKIEKIKLEKNFVKKKKELIDEMEYDMYAIGATCVEDKL